MLSRRALAALLAATLAGGAAALLAAPVLACKAGVCHTPTPTGTAVSAVYGIPGLPPQVTSHTNSGTSWTQATAPSCPATVVYEPVGGGPGVYGWTSPGGVNHLVHGSPPSPNGWSLAEYWVAAEYSRTMSPSPSCQPGPWLFAGFVGSPVAFPPPTTSTPGVTPAIKALEAEVTANLVGGSVMTAGPKYSLVNLPEFAWIVGSNITRERLKSTTVTYTPPRVGGREEVLTIAVDLFRTGVLYNWGDQQTTFAGAGSGALGAPYPVDGISHTYHDVTVYKEEPAPWFPPVNAQGQLQISATQELSVSSWAVWIDASGRHQVELGSFPLAIPVQPHFLTVLQVEGVPFCLTKTSCA